MKFLFCAVFITFCKLTLASRILVLYPTPSKSHVIALHGLSTTLAEKGHDVTVFSSFPLEKKLKNHRDIKLPLSKEAASYADELLKNPKKSMIPSMFKMIEMTIRSGKDLMEMPEYTNVLKEEKFDLVVIGLFMNNFLLGVGDHFKCPTMMMSAAGAFTFTNLLFGNPLEVSAVPHMMTFKSGRMNFWDRVMNFVAYGFDLTMSCYLDYKQQKVYE